MARIRTFGGHRPMASLHDMIIRFVRESLITRAFAGSCRWRQGAEGAEIGALANPSHPGYAGNVDSFHFLASPPAGDALDRASSHRLVRCSPTDHQGKAAHLSCMLRMLRARRHGCTRLTWLRLSPLLSSAMPNGTRCLPGACRAIEPGPLHRGHALSELAERDCRRRCFRGVEEW